MTKWRAGFAVAVAATLILGAATKLRSYHSAAAAAADWPQWHGPNRDAISTETGLLKSWPEGGPKLAWQVRGLGEGFSSLAITGGKLFTMGDRGDDQFVEALNLTDGKTLWSTKIGPAHHDEYGGPRGTPTVDGALLYAIGTEGEVVCLETATGKERWHKSLSTDFGGKMSTMWKFSESPLVDENRVVVTPGMPDVTLVALDKMTGKEVWRSAAGMPGPKGRPGAAYSSIVISNAGGVKQYVQLTGQGLVGVRASDGKALWTYNKIANNVANIPTPLVRNDYIFTSTGYQTGAALVQLEKTGDAFNAKEIYFLEPRVFQNHHGGYVRVGDYLYAGHGHNNGFPICIEFPTGKVMWGGDIRNAGKNSAAVLYADGNLYFRYQNGLMMLIEASPSGYKEKGSFQIPDVQNPSWSHPVILGGKLYIREQDHLYVYDIRG
ncbi:MAG: PQQ-like beta-propeller repeat protein [Acidobacteria bacterium]|nr:PQQ-like beta-propeller repeat protein [Acidobacteriota bacterium]